MFVRTRPKSSDRERGASALEFLTAFAFLAILSAMGVVEYRDLSRAYHREHSVREFAADLRRARSEAVSIGARIMVGLEDGGSAYTVGADLVSYALTIDEVRYRAQLSPGITIDSNRDLIFDSRGFLVDDTGENTSATVTFSQQGTPYSTFTITPLGVLVGS